MYVENQDGFEGEQEIIRKFGVELRDDVSLVVSKNQMCTSFDNQKII